MKQFKCVVVTVFVLCTLSVVCSAETTDSDATVIKDNLSFECVNNVSCVTRVARNFLTRLRTHKAIDLGFMRIEPTVEEGVETGRSTGSSILDLMNGNAVQVPVGPMVFSVEKARDYDNYLEISLLKKGSASEGRRRGDGGEGGGGGGGGGFGNRRRDRKHMQMFMPMMLGMHALGWTALAFGIVKILTIKALIVSKLAFLLTAFMVVKKMFDSSSERIIPSPYEHHPGPYDYSPYHMDYSGHHSHFGGHDITVPDLSFLPSSNILDSTHLHGLGSFGSESHVNSVVDTSNVGSSQMKINKRNDIWTGFRRKPQSSAGLMAAAAKSIFPQPNQQR